MAKSSLFLCKIQIDEKLVMFCVCHCDDDDPKRTRLLPLLQLLHTNDGPFRQKIHAQAKESFDENAAKSVAGNGSRSK